MGLAPRPSGITVLAVLEAIGGITFLFFGILVFGALSMLGAISGEAASLLETLGGFLGAFFILIAIFNFIIASGLLNGRGWAWTLGIIFGIIGIITGVIAIPTGVLNIIINAVIIYYLYRPHVKQFFGKL